MRSVKVSSFGNAALIFIITVCTRSYCIRFENTIFNGNRFYIARGCAGQVIGLQKNPSKDPVSASYLLVQPLDTCSSAQVEHLCIFEHLNSYMLICFCCTWEALNMSQPVGRRRPGEIGQPVGGPFWVLLFFPLWRPQDGQQQSSSNCQSLLGPRPKILLHRLTSQVVKL